LNGPGALGQYKQQPCALWIFSCFFCQEDPNTTVVDEPNRLIKKQKNVLQFQQIFESYGLRVWLKNDSDVKARKKVTVDVTPII
jgi:hypothetical protein